MKILISILVVICTLSLSCASKEEKLERAKEKVKIINDSTAWLKGESIYIRGAEQRTRFTYYTIGGEIKFINEEVFTLTGHFVNLYYFDDGKLIYLDSRSISYIPSEKGTTKKPADKKIYFDNKTVLESDVIIMGEKVELERSQIDEIINYAAYLLDTSYSHIKNNKQ